MYVVYVVYVVYVLLYVSLSGHVVRATHSNLVLLSGRAASRCARRVDAGGKIQDGAADSKWASGGYTFDQQIDPDDKSRCGLENDSTVLTPECAEPYEKYADGVFTYMQY